MANDTKALAELKRDMAKVADRTEGITTIDARMANIEAIPDGRGVHMIDGKMQDDATWKQCKVMVDLAKMLAAKDEELREAYGFVEETDAAPAVA